MFWDKFFRKPGKNDESCENDTQEDIEREWSLSVAKLIFKSWEKSHPKCIVICTTNQCGRFTGKGSVFFHRLTTRIWQQYVNTANIKSIPVYMHEEVMRRHLNCSEKMFYPNRVYWDNKVKVIDEDTFLHKIDSGDNMIVSAVFDQYGQIMSMYQLTGERLSFPDFPKILRRNNEP